MAFKFQVAWETKMCDAPTATPESTSTRRKTEHWTIVHVRDEMDAETALFEALEDQANWPWWSDGNCSYALVDAHARAPRR